MARMARVVVPGFPHHVTQRGNRRQRTFFSEDDYATYIQLLSKAAAKACVEIWAYCLMPNHVHFVAVPRHADSLSALFSDAHRRYTRHVNFREGWRGHLWQERFHSVVMDDNHLIATVRYTELNPVRARLCAAADEWRWSSVHAHLARRDDELVTVAPMSDRFDDWRSYLATENPPATLTRIREHSRTGRPIGNDDFLDKLQQLSGTDWRKRKPGPPGRS